MWVYVCVYAHTHIHCTHGVLECEPKSRDETPGGPEESGWTKSRHMYIRICVHRSHPMFKVHMFTYMLGGGMRSWTNCVFLQHIFSSKKEKQRMWNANQR